MYVCNDAAITERASARQPSRVSFVHTWGDSKSFPSRPNRTIETSAGTQADPGECDSDCGRRYAMKMERCLEEARSLNNDFLAPPSGQSQPLPRSTGPNVSSFRRVKG